MTVFDHEGKTLIAIIMITGEIKNKLDRLWDAMWSNQMTNPWIDIQQVTYLIFIKMLDDNQIKQERKYNDMKANGIDIAMDESKLTFKSGNYVVIPQFKNYKRRVLDYLTDNMDHPVVQKIRHIENLTNQDLKELERIFWEELGTQADYDETFKGEPIAAFVRRTVGLENSAVQKMLGHFLQLYEFNSMQEEFIHQIVNYVRQNGDIAPNNLINSDPFRNVEYTELFEEKTKAVYDIVKTLHNAIYIGA